MQNEDLKSLVTQMYKNLISTIDEQEYATKEQVVDFLKDATLTIESIDNDDINSVEHAKNSFTNAYKEIAKNSLTSYKNTNGRFEELTKMHQDTISECNAEQIDLPTITEKFNEIQLHMNVEVKKANETISQLNRQVKELEAKSNLDALTKVFNRRAMITYLNKLCSKSGISFELHLLILDIDDFKQVNDKYGHVAGDKILIYIANILKKTLRDGDKIFRYGGEEFVIVLNRIDDKECLLITQRLLELVRSNKLIYKGHNINVTTSIGTTKYIDGDTQDTLITRADKALYKAKHSGKNKICTEV